VVGAVAGVVVAGVVVGVVVGQPIATRLRANNNANGINNNFFFNSPTPLLDFYSSTSLIFYHHLPYFLGCSSIFCAPPLAAMALHPDFPYVESECSQVHLKYNVQSLICQYLENLCFLMSYECSCCY